MDFIFEPSLALYLPLYELDGASFMSKDAYGHMVSVTGATWGLQGRGFDGLDDYGDCGLGDSLKITGAITILAWVYPAPPHLQGAAGILNNISGYQNSRLLIRDDGSLVAQVVIAGNAQNVEFAALANNTWHYVAYRYDGANEVWFGDGMKGADYAKTGSINTGSNNVVFAWGHHTHAYYHFKGRIAEIRIYSRALTALEIERDYLATKWRYR